MKDPEIVAQFQTWSIRLAVDDRRLERPADSAAQAAEKNRAALDVPPPTLRHSKNGFRNAGRALRGLSGPRPALQPWMFGSTHTRDRCLIYR